MYFKFQELPMWMSRRKVDKHMPPSFRQWYPTTRVIIDATEFFIEKPSSLARQSATWSSYKNHNTFKSLLGQNFFFLLYKATVIIFFVSRHPRA